MTTLPPVSEVVPALLPSSGGDRSRDLERERPTRIRTSSLAFVAALLGSGLAGTALAEPTYWDPDFPLLGTECIDCHVDPEGVASCNMSSAHPRHPCLNPFGQTFRSTAGGYDATLGAADQDGDSMTNLFELTHGGSAGFAQGAESVGCDMLDAALLTDTWVACGSSNVEVMATWSSTPSNSYGFAFQCAAGSSPPVDAADTDWSDRCLDPDECTGNPCAPGDCTQVSLGPAWASPGYTCTCDAGYASSGAGCLLVDACVAGSDDCVALASCVDTAGDSPVYACECPDDHTGDGTISGSGCTPAGDTDTGDTDTGDTDTGDTDTGDTGDTADTGDDSGDADSSDPDDDGPTGCGCVARGTPLPSRLALVLALAGLAATSRRFREPLLHVTRRSESASAHQASSHRGDSVSRGRKTPSR